MDKTISLQLNKNRKITGTLRGYDQFMNIVLGDAIEEVKESDVGHPIGTVVRTVVTTILNFGNIHLYYFAHFFQFLCCRLFVVIV